MARRKSEASAMRLPDGRVRLVFNPPLSGEGAALRVMLLVGWEGDGSIRADAKYRIVAVEASEETARDVLQTLGIKDAAAQLAKVLAPPAPA